MSDEDEDRFGQGRRASDEIIRKAISSLDRAVDALNKTVEALNKTVETLQGAVFGRWDERTNERIPGVHDRVAKLEKTFRIAAVWFGAPVLFVLFLRAVGVPTEDVGRFLSAFFKQFGG